MPESTNYAIQHKTTKAYLLLPPRLQLHKTTLLPKAAHRWDTMSEAMMEILEHMGDFGSAFEVVPMNAVPPHRV